MNFTIIKMKIFFKNVFHYKTKGVGCFVVTLCLEKLGIIVMVFLFRDFTV